MNASGNIGSNRSGKGTPAGVLDGPDVRSHWGPFRTSPRQIHIVRAVCVLLGCVAPVGIWTTLFLQVTSRRIQLDSASVKFVFFASCAVVLLASIALLLWMLNVVRSPATNRILGGVLMCGAWFAGAWAVFSVLALLSITTMGKGVPIPIAVMMIDAVLCAVIYSLAAVTARRGALDSQ